MGDNSGVEDVQVEKEGRLASGCLLHDDGEKSNDQQEKIKLPFVSGGTANARGDSRARHLTNSLMKNLASTFFFL